MGINENAKESIWWGLFGIYLVAVLVYYRKSYNKLSCQLKKSVDVDVKNNKIFDKFIRRSAYIFWYSYVVYWIFSFSQFEEYGKVNFFEAFKISIFGGDFIVILTFLAYLLSWSLIALPMIGDGFGIVPIICNVSKDIGSKNKEKINLYHPDRSAGFRPLGDFCFKMSLLIALPFIIGMPIQLYKDSNSISDKGFINYILYDPFNMAFIGVGIAGSVIFIFSIYYINRLIEKRKRKN